MRKRIGVVVLGLALSASLSACATEQYGIPPGGPNYASWDHLIYSHGGDKPALTKKEAKLAKEEGWWGTPVRYNVDELE